MFIIVWTCIIGKVTIMNEIKTANTTRTKPQFLPESNKLVHTYYTTRISLNCSPDHQAVVEHGVVCLDTAFAEVEAFVEENSWFNEIEEFCNTWDVKAKLSWKGAQAFHIEVTNDILQ